MKELFRHIDHLLLHHECVIVPGVGGFLTHAATSFYDEDEQAFFPPHRTIGFNPQLVLNDGTLVRSYMEATKCDYKKASLLMQRDIRALQERVKTLGECYIDSVGTLKQSRDGKYTFLPLESGALTPSLFALPRFEIQPLPIANQQEKVITMKVSTVRRVVSVAAAAVAVVLLSIPFLHGSDNQMPTTTQQAASPLRVLATEKVQANEQNHAEVLDKVRNMFSQSSAEEQQVLPDEYFTIVLACDVAEENCRIYADMIKKEDGLDKDKLHVYADHIY